MRFGVALLLGCSLALGGCAARGGPPTAQAGAAAPAPAVACGSDDHPGSRWREMTWAEYYADVEARAFRNGATVIWIETPQVTKVPKREWSRRLAAARCAR